MRNQALDIERAVRGKCGGGGRPSRGDRVGAVGPALPPESASGTAPCGLAALPVSGCRSPESSCLGEKQLCGESCLRLQGRRQGANAKSTQGNKGALSQATTGSQGGAKS